MGKYSAEAAACNEYLNSAVSKLNAIKANQEATLSKLSGNEDVLASCVINSCKPIAGKIDSVIASINNLASSISSKAAELDAAIEEEERRRREAEQNN